MGGSWFLWACHLTAINSIVKAAKPLHNFYWGKLYTFPAFIFFIFFFCLLSHFPIETALQWGRKLFPKQIFPPKKKGKLFFLIFFSHTFFDGLFKLRWHIFSRSAKCEKQQHKKMKKTNTISQSFSCHLRGTEKK